jgi:hypothetical protein
MAGYLSATRGPFVSYGNTPRSDQLDTITAGLPNLNPLPTGSKTTTCISADLAGPVATFQAGAIPLAPRGAAAVWFTVHHRAMPFETGHLGVLVQVEPIRTAATRAVSALGVHVPPGSAIDGIQKGAWALISLAGCRQ